TEGDAGARNLIGHPRDQFVAVKKYGAGAVTHDTHDRLQRRGFAGAVASEQRDNLTFMHVEGYTVQDVRLAVPGLQILDRKHGCAHVKHARPPYRLRELRGCPPRYRS